FGIQAAHAAPAAKPDRPNIPLIMADDVGYTDLGSSGSEIATPKRYPLADTGVEVSQLYASPVASSTGAEPRTGSDNLLVGFGYTDLGSFGSEIATPNLDTLADTGVKMTQFYASPFCSPTRAMLMSGSDNHLVGFGDMAELMLPEQRGKPGYEGNLNQRVVPMAQVLRDAGYRTLMTGKWHLGVPEEFSPATRGFDQSYVLVHGGSSHWSDQAGIVAVDPAKPPKAIYRENGKAVDVPKDFFS